MHRFRVTLALALWAAVVSALPAAAMPPAAHAGANPDASPGARLFLQHCAICHQGQAPGAPAKVFLQMMSPASILAAIATGMMSTEASSLTPAQKRQVADYLGAQNIGAGTAHAPPLCRGSAAQFQLSQAPV